MNNNKLVDSLEGLGLTDKEAQIYYAALSLGPTTIQKLAQAAEVKRTTAYSLVESLKKKGLMNIEMDRTKKKFVAENPERLEAILDQRKKAFHVLLPEFAAMYNLQGGESFVKYYEGIEALKGVYESFIKDILPDQDYLVISNTASWIDLDKEYFIDFMERRAILPIKIRHLVQDSVIARDFQKNQQNYNATTKILPSQTNIRINMVVTPQRVLFHQLTPPIIGIVIENKNVIEMHREMFEIIWNSLN